MRPNYKLGYKLNNNLEVVREHKVIVSDDRSSSWQQIFPDHRYTNYKVTMNGQMWKHIDYHQ